MILNRLLSKWRSLPKAGRRTVLIGLALNEVRGLVTVALVLTSAHHLRVFPFH